MSVKRAQQRRQVAAARLFPAALVLLLLCIGTQAAEPGNLAITGAVERPLNLRISDLEKMPHVQVDVKDHDGQGPFRLVAPHEKRPARWIRMLQRIEVVKVQ